MHRTGPAVQFLSVERDLAPARPVIGPTLFGGEFEAMGGDGWTVKSRWPTNHPESLDRTVEWAKNYVGWLKDVD